MATNALTCSASTLVSNNMASRSLLPAGLGRHSVSLPPTRSSKAPFSRPSLVAEAQKGGGRYRSDPVEGEHYDKTVTIHEIPPDGRIQWRTTAYKNEIKIEVDMPGIEDENIEVDNDLLVIKEFEEDVYGNIRTSHRKTIFQLPSNAKREEIRIERPKTGHLDITVPKNPEVEVEAMRPRPLL